ncbi:alanine racemase [Paramicrobacterium chengjingii]|uniref:Alanine racemase n=1 Tax=Paramicrobacterium chengjingii TaxID=2769067 RepID=A0ABX6YI32_9MICO|nr:alanine racemase [Microbacterium chengjingii]QPZ37997.1 alanine racemase [Microbacterium chengjingii]
MTIPLTTNFRMPTPLLTVDLTAIAANTQFFSNHIGGELMAVVKADGYGLGARDVARTALENGATSLGVTSLDEGFALRDAGFSARVLSWLNHPTEADYAGAAEASIDVAVSSVDQLRAVAQAAGRACVHLHLDTGLTRDGADPALWIDLCRRARQNELEGRIEVVGVMGHLPEGDNLGAPSSRVGCELFDWGTDIARLTGLTASMRHLGATTAALTVAGSHHTMCRIGAGLAGIDLSRTVHLKSPMTLAAPLIGVRSVRAGTSVGYGLEWKATESTRLGLIGLGYADGIPRSSAERGEVLVRGTRRPVVGRVSMDQIVVDLGREGGEIGEPAVVFGSGADGEPTVREWADWSGTIEHEIMTRVGERVTRRTTNHASLNEEAA